MSPCLKKGFCINQNAMCDQKYMYMYMKDLCKQPQTNAYII